MLTCFNKKVFQLGICLFALIFIVRIWPILNSKRTVEDVTHLSPTADYKWSKHASSEWMILLTVNNAFFDFFVNWYWYYKKLDLNLPITIIADDDESFKKLKSAYNSCSVLRSGLNISGAQDYKTKQYKILVSTRPQHILQLLQNGNDVLYADVDSVWVKNPLPFLNKTYDISIQSDGPSNLCTGFMAIKSNSKTIDVIQQWHDLLVGQPNTNQQSFNKAIRSSKVSYMALNSLYFPSGKQYFKNYDEKERSQAVVVHNNWIVGHDVKKKRFKKFNLWRV